MAGSLQDQLLNSGLISQKKAKKIKKQKKHKAKIEVESVNEAEELAKKAMAEEKERARQLNLKRQQALEEKAIAAQIKQLIKQNRQKHSEEGKPEVSFKFTDDTTIKSIVISETVRDKISRGQLAIVKLDDDYALVPNIIADKIAERDTGIVILRNKTHDDQAEDDDPYADYQIPDDLMW